MPPLIYDNWTCPEWQLSLYTTKYNYVDENI